MIEKVNPEHPDKVADRIAGAIVDLAYTKQESPKIAVEVLIGHGVANVIIESSVAFSKEEVYSRELLKLDFKWMDLGEKDDRSITELLTDMQNKASSIADAVAKLQELLGGIDL